MSVLAGPTKKACPEKLDIPSTQSCCKLPKIDFKPYEKQCGDLGVNGLHVWPCGFQCIYKTAGALNGTTLVMENVDAMMATLLKDEEKLKEAFALGFRACTSKEQEIVHTLKRRRFPDSSKCSPLAMLYGVCAYKYVFNNCPTENWTNSSTCNRILACERAKDNMQ
ncbi:uncharacterized protein LOC132793115 [Drosophila nasuta]|uniref:uncharacterized protein LOC132793115 n=1 Tax=Drosophila nasuta TaxID=42062 RepID=UPI00295F414B|nr:uncharacterized protein LOC132793115 [Drosophila nasuta]